jgi:hypothetical protein
MKTSTPNKASALFLIEDRQKNKRGLNCSGNKKAQLSCAKKLTTN